ncbi:MAG: SusD/RagB family nutrient-binding outer membrane lipoprotein [Bacteroidota bacterium]
MKSIFKYCLVAVLSLSAFQSCELAELNVDPTRPADVALNLMMPEAITSSVFNQYSNPARISGLVIQQFRGFDAQQVAYSDNYSIPEITFNNYWRTGLYAGSLKTCQRILDKAIEGGNPHYQGIAKILMADGFGTAASYFGDIPFSEALKGIDDLKPAYDTQQAVYAGVQTLLDEAIALLNQPASAAPPTNDDLIFGGDAAKWIATANALKARYYMHTQKRDAGAAGNALTLIQNSAFQSAADQPNFAFGSGQTDNNPLAKFGVERPNTIVIDSRFADQMTANADPRQVKYMEFDGENWLFFNDSNTDLIWAANASVMPLISFVELKFLETEALYHTGASDSDVQDALIAAITASMEANGIAQTDYQAYVDTYGDLGGLSSAEIHERIMVQAYFAYYGVAFPQSFANFRRTGHPSLTPAPNGTNGLNPSGGVPQRWLYAASEAQTNSANLEVARNNQGGALMDVPVWAFQ